jgi:hypothetical protein
MAVTTHGLPYPLPTDPVSAGASDIQRLAEAIDALVLAGVLAWPQGLTLREHAPGWLRLEGIGPGGGAGGILLPSGTPGFVLEFGQVGQTPGPPAQAGARLYAAWDPGGGGSALTVIWPNGARTVLATQPALDEPTAKPG